MAMKLECSPALAQSSASQAALTTGLVTLLVVPWLWPFTPGPTPNTAPLLVAWACLLVALPWLAGAGWPKQQLAHVIARAWLVAALCNAVIALGQWFGVNPAWDFLSSAHIGEAYGNLRQRNHFASLTSLGLAAIVFMPAACPRALRWPAVVLLASANVASASRTGLLQWVLLAAIAAAWPGPRRPRAVLCAGALLAYLAAAAVLPALLEHWRGVEAVQALTRVVTELGCSSRKVLWSNVLTLIWQRPMAGWGLGELDYAHYATLYTGERFCDILDNAHNLPLHLAVELGIPIAVLAAAVVAAAIWRQRPWLETAAPRQLAWAALALIGVHSLLEYPLWYGPFQLAVACALLLLMPPLPAAGPRLQFALRSASLALLVVIAWTWQVYDTVSQAYKPAAERRPAMRENPILAAGQPPIFRDQLRFAQLSITAVSKQNASAMASLAQDMLHYSPEPAVIEKRIDSARLLGREDEALWHAARYKAAFPERYQAWIADRAPAPGLR